MVEPTHDDLGAAFANFRTAALPHIRPAGLGPVRAMARRRRTIRVGLAAATAVLATVGPLAAYAATNHPPVRPQPATSNSASVAPSRSVPPNGAGRLSPGTPVYVSGQPVDCSSAPGDGGTGPLVPADLCNATLTLSAPGTPGFPACLTGTVTFHQGSAPMAGKLVRAVAVDADRNGRPDVAALIQCQPGDPATQAVYVFTRGDSGGVRTIGTVVGPQPVGSGDGSAITGAFDLGAYSNGAVRVQVDNLNGSDGYAVAKALRQWRTYRWSGSRFIQSAGHTSFLTDPNRAGLSVSVGKVTSSGDRVSFRVTFHNRGYRTSEPVSLVVNLGDLPAVPPCTTPPSGISVATCPVGAIPAGKSRTVTVTFNSSGGPYQPSGVDFLQVRLGDQQLELFTGFQTG